MHNNPLNPANMIPTTVIASGGNVKVRNTPSKSLCSAPEFLFVVFLWATIDFSEQVSNLPHISDKLDKFARPFCLAHRSLSWFVETCAEFTFTQLLFGKFNVQSVATSDKQRDVSFTFCLLFDARLSAFLCQG